MPRIPDDVVEEIIDNDGCRRGSATPINATGVVRLALDLQEARAELDQLKAQLEGRDGDPYADTNRGWDRMLENTTGGTRAKRTKKK